MDPHSLTDRHGRRNILSPPTDPDREFILNGCTYAKLYHLAAGLCRLPRATATERPFICLCTDDKALLMAALIAALAGGPRLVLPYAFSRQALTEVLETLSPAFYFIDKPGDLPNGPQVVTPAQLPREATLPQELSAIDEPFLFLFTGGSTGKPKVWPKTPRNMLSEAHYQATTLGMTRDDLILSTVPPQHIYGLLFSVLIPFLCSARVLKEIYTFPSEILRIAEEHQATILVSVPVHYRALKTDDLRRFALRRALSSAGVLDKEDAAFFYRKTGLDVTEVFGSTETGGIATRRRVQDNDCWIPLDPVAWKIQDGRLRVRSAFISPTLPRDEEGFFITADRAHDAGGNRFTIHGRADDIVKIGGKRVDLAVVQAKLKQIPGVRDAVVVSLPSGKGRQHELATLVATQLKEIDVRRHLTQICESYAVPKRITVVEAIPTTSTGKYDRSEIERVLSRA
jgi:acyl-coenzyme A synthetase/AMP-(fatty) acid ligase